VAGPLRFGVSLIVERVLSMPLRSRRMVLESLECRQLLSVSHPSGEVSALAKSKHIQVVGSLTGSVTPIPSQEVDSFVATGDLGTLGPVQVQSTFPAGPSSRFVFPLTSALGTLSFTTKSGRHGYTLTLKQGTGAYTGWTGTGTLTLTPLGPPGAPTGPPTPVPASFALKLTLKT
jgi:hypothetical protein